MSLNVLDVFHSSSNTISLTFFLLSIFDTQMVFLKEFFEKVDFEKKNQTTKKHGKFPKAGWVEGDGGKKLR